MKISEQIKIRLKQYAVPFHASDNISKYILKDEFPLLEEELTQAFSSVLDSLLIDQENDPNSKDTARRLAKMYLYEIMEGRYSPPPDVTSFPNSSYDGMIVIRAELKSMCSHHHQPVTGVAYIGILPASEVIGLSKYIRLAQWCARRGTLQEELTLNICEEVMDAANTKDVAVHIGAEHGCCTNRGVMAHSSLTQTTVLRGQFKEPDVKAEFFNKIALQKTTNQGVY